MDEKPNYYAIIPATVRYDKDLSDKAKLLYGEISALTNKTGECWASNKYFSELYGITTIHISRLINELKEKNYIDVELIYKINSKQIEKRTIKLKSASIKEMLIPINENVNTPINENVNTPINENVKDNNTSINNTSNNISFIEEKKQKKEDIFINPVIDNFKKQAEEVFKQKFYLLNAHREKILELNREIEDFPSACDEVFNRLKEINFPDVGFKPSVVWLLKEDNFLKVLNGEFNKRDKEKDDNYFERVDNIVDRILAKNEQK